MALVPDDVRAMADYARLALGDDELEPLCAYLNDAIELLQPIRAYDLTGVEPTFSPVGGLVNVMADDVADQDGRSLDRAAALGNASATRGRLFRVPALMDGPVDRECAHEGTGEGDAP